MAKRSDNVFVSKLAAKFEMKAMLFPTICGAAMTLLPEALLSVGLLAMLGYFNENRQLTEISDSRFLIYCGIFLLAELLICQPLYCGLMRYLALRRKGLQPSAMETVTAPLASFRLYRQAIALAVMIALHSLLWAIPSLALCGVGFALMQLVGGTIGSFLFYEAAIFAAAFYFVMTIRYHCAYLLVTDQPTMRCWQAVRLTAKMFRGHKREILSLLLSFIFWYCLLIFCGGILLIYVCPYIMLSVFHLFDCACGCGPKLQVMREDK